MDKIFFEDYGGFHYVNELTVEMDSYLREEHRFKTYIYITDKEECIETGYPIRYPGATRGVIKVDKDNTITAIELTIDEHNTHTIYNSKINDIFKKYVGRQITFDKPIEEPTKA